MGTARRREAAVGARDGVRGGKEWEGEIQSLAPPTQHACAVRCREAAVGLVSRLVPEPSLGQRTAALERAARHALARGVTTVGDMGRCARGGG